MCRLQYHLFVCPLIKTSVECFASIRVPFLYAELRNFSFNGFRKKVVSLRCCWWGWGQKTILTNDGQALELRHKRFGTRCIAGCRKSALSPAPRGKQEQDTYYVAVDMEARNRNVWAVTGLSPVMVPETANHFLMLWDLKNFQTKVHWHVSTQYENKLTSARWIDRHHRLKGNNYTYQLKESR